MFSKHRVEALSDGVFAIAMTLLILEIKVPIDVPAGGLWHALRQENHEWISFVITFGITASFWTTQHKLFDVLDRIGSGSLVLTFAALGFVTILPFSTSLWGHHIADPVAFLLYFVNQLAIAASLLAKLELAMRKSHVHLGRDAALLRLRLWATTGIMATAALATRLIQLKYLWIVLVVCGLTARFARARFARRWPTPASLETSPIPQITP